MAVKKKFSRRLIGAVIIPVLGLFGAGMILDTDEAEAVDGGMRLEADVSERVLRVYKGGQLTRTYTVAVGQPSDPTPRGNFAIRRIVWNPGWVPPDEKWARGKTAKDPGEKGNPMRVAKIFFREPDYYIHGTPFTSSLGDAASRGCLRMAPGEVAQLAADVMAYGGSKRDWSWIKRTLRIGSTRTVHLSNAVPLRITD